MGEQCGFCGQTHEPAGAFLGIPLCACPNLPAGWWLVGPNADGDLVIGGTDD